MSEPPDPYKAWHEDTVKTPSDSVGASRIVSPENREALRSFKIIAGFFLLGLLILCAFVGYWKYCEIREKEAAVVASEAAEASRVTEAHKKQQEEAAAETARLAERHKQQQEAAAANVIAAEAEAAAESSRLVQAKADAERANIELLKACVNDAAVTKGIVLVASVDQSGHPQWQLAEKLQQVLRSLGVNAESHAFTQTFFTSPYAAGLYAGLQKPILEKLGLAKEIGGLILTTATISVGTPDQNGFITARIDCVIRSFDASTRPLATRSLKLSGSALNETDAIAAALTRLENMFADKASLSTLGI